MPTASPSPSGCTSTPATSAALSNAVAAAAAGAVICPVAGTYSGVTFANSGTAAAPITLIGSSVATISAPASSIAINLNGKSHIAIQNMIVIGGLWGVVTTGGNYDSVLGSRISGAAAGGISLNNGDHMTVQHNIVSGCGDTWSGSASGISLWEATAVDAAAGWHNVISYNQSFANCNPQGGTDGNGIIIDSFEQSGYTYPTLVEENLTWSNCGAGIKNYDSANVTIRNNTNYQNQTKTLTPYTWRGEISLEYGSTTVVANNINWPNRAFNSSNTAILDEGAGDILANNIDGSAQNPMLANPPALMNLLPGSPAIGAGTSAYGLPTANFAGAPIVTPNIGAY